MSSASNSNSESRSCAAYAMGEMRLTQFAETRDLWAMGSAPLPPPASTRYKSTCFTFTKTVNMKTVNMKQVDLRLPYAGPIASAAGESGHFATGRAT